MTDIGEAIDKESTSLRDILVQKFNWTDESFGHSGFASLGYRKKQQLFSPRKTFVQRLIGGSSGRAIPVAEVIAVGSLLKFSIPAAEARGTADFSWWRGMFDREVRYSTISHGLVFDRWVAFRGLQTGGFDFDVSYLDGDVAARIPTTVLVAVDWIRLAPNEAAHRSLVELFKSIGTGVP